MIIQAVITAKRVEGHIRNISRIAAVAVADHTPGECRPNRVEVRCLVQIIRTQHLGIDRSLDREGRSGILETVSPCLLPEDALILDNKRMQAGIGIVIRVFEKLRLGKTGYGVAGMPALRIRVHKGVVCLIARVEPQGPGRIFFAAVKYAVFKHMRQTRLVNRIRHESKIKYPVRIIVGDIGKPGLCFLMLKYHHLGADRRKRADLLRLEAEDHISRFRKRSCFRSSISRELRFGRKFRLSRSFSESGAGHQRGKRYSKGKYNSSFISDHCGPLSWFF